MFQPLNWKKFLFILVILVLPLKLLALPQDNQQMVHIVADSSTFNYKTGENIYQGNVHIDQGSTRLTADRVVTTTNFNHKMETATAYGINQLAEYTTIPKAGDTALHAKAKIIKFFPLTSLVQLEGDVTVNQGKNSFHGPVILYNMKDQIITAPPSKTGRATILIEPGQIKT